MRGRSLKGLLGTIVSAALIAGFAFAVAPSTALACETAQMRIAAVARGYGSSDGSRYLDGIVTNDTTQTLCADHVDISWAENGRIVTEAWLCSAFLAPGEWTTFHIDWPRYIPDSWTPQAVGVSYADDGPGKLPLTVSDVSSASTDGDGNRFYTVGVTNPNPFSVSSLDVIGAEKDATSTAFVDALDSCNVPDSIGAGDSAQIVLTGYSPWDGQLTVDTRVLGLEKPVLTLSADNLTPAAGTPIGFTLTMTHEDGTPVTGCRELKLYYSRDGEEWERSFHLGLRHDSDTTTATVYTWKPTYFKAVYCGDGDLGWTESSVLFAQPSGDTAVTPPKLPGRVRRHHVFVVRGRVGGDPQSSGAKIVVTAERKSGRHWKRTTSLKVAPSDAGTFSAKLKLSATGTYRVRAFRSGVGYTPFRTLKVVK